MSLQGTVVVFSKTTCGHCKKAKALLESKRIQNMAVLQLDELDPSVREWMLAHTENAKTVPQIFFNDEWIPGGASNLAKLEEDGALDGMLATKLEHELPRNSPLRSLIVDSQYAALNAALKGDEDF